MKQGIKTVLKTTSMLVPALIFALSAAGLGTAHAAYAKEKERIYKLYRETDEDFSRAQRLQQDNLDEDFKAGLLTREEYDEKKEYLSSDKFTESVIELDSTLDDEVKLLKDSKNKFLIAAYSTFATGLISGGLSCAIYPEKIKELRAKLEIHKNASKNKDELPKPIVYNLDEERKTQSKTERKKMSDYHEEDEEQTKK